MNKKLTRSVLSVLLATGLMAATAAQASYVSEVEPNNSIATAQSLQPYFSTNFDAIITNSTTMAHASVNGTGNGSFDYYSFNLSTASTVIFDIDNTSHLDSWLNLYTGSGALLTSVDDASRDPGSSTALDSYLSTNLGAGLYYIAVGSFPNRPVENGAVYTLHVSATTPSAVPLPAAAPLMLSGLAVMGGLARRRKQKIAAAV